MKIEISNLSFDYPTGEFGIQIPELQIESGQSLALVGPSGCGKTTFLNLLSALITPQSGGIRVGELALKGLGDRERRAYRAGQTGYVFQDFGLVDYLTARENILYTYLVTDRPVPVDLDNRIQNLAESFGIDHILHKKPARISQGEKQRVAICRAILPRPQLILADEPTGNLDPENKAAILEHLFAQASETGATLVVVTHDIALSGRFDKVVDFAQYGKRGA
ncbi:ABC transporter ATP-binding protein [Primorskyibacter sp. S87]|uniref:ABC transporter ATP-binding protein n=1 Tax=Primorskyibacter sp. S87 TaxID=3415126 RepID=UPI003C7E3A70